MYFVWYLGEVLIHMNVIRYLALPWPVCIFDQKHIRLVFVQLTSLLLPQYCMVLCEPQGFVFTEAMFVPFNFPFPYQQAQKHDFLGPSD